VNEIEEAFVRDVMRLTGVTREDLLLAGIEAEAEKVLQRLVTEGKAVQVFNADGSVSYRKTKAS
jgi:hypothetical protein